MRVAVVGSRSIQNIDLEKHLPLGTTAIISGGARGVDTIAAEYARSQGLALTEIRPDYARYGRAAPLKRNIEIIESADFVLIFWDGHSKGTKFAIDECKKRGIPNRVELQM